MRAAGDLLKPAAIDLCRYIDEKAFTDAVVSLGLLSENDLLQESDDDNDDIAEVSSTTSSSITSSSLSSSCSITTVC